MLQCTVSLICILICSSKDDQISNHLIKILVYFIYYSVHGHPLGIVSKLVVLMIYSVGT